MKTIFTFLMLIAWSATAGLVQSGWTTTGNAATARAALGVDTSQFVSNANGKATNLTSAGWIATTNLTNFASGASIIINSNVSPAISIQAPNLTGSTDTGHGEILFVAGNNGTASTSSVRMKIGDAPDDYTGNTFSIDDGLGNYIRFDNDGQMSIAATGEIRALTTLNLMGNAIQNANGSGITNTVIPPIRFKIDGQGSVIGAGSNAVIYIENNLLIKQVTLLADNAGSVQLDLRKCTYAQYDCGATHPSAGDSIVASAPPTISVNTKSQDSTLTGWTKTLSAGDVLQIYVTSATTIKWVQVSIKVVPR